MKPENRFKLARTKYNQHGSQTVKAVSDATGITKSLIDDLETTVPKERGTSYIKVAILAKHYGVSADYLLGLRESPYTDTGIANACEVTGLTKRAVEKLRDFNKNNQYTAHSDVASIWIEDLNFETLLLLIENRITYFMRSRMAKTDNEHVMDMIERTMKIDLDGIHISTYKNIIADSLLQQEVLSTVRYICEIYAGRFSDTPVERRETGEQIAKEKFDKEREKLLKELREGKNNAIDTEENNEGRSGVL